MAASRQLYVKLADVINNLHLSKRDRFEVSYQIACVLAEDNPGFNRTVFIDRATRTNQTLKWQRDRNGNAI